MAPLATKLKSNSLPILGFSRPLRRATRVNSLPLIRSTSPISDLKPPSRKSSRRSRSPYFKAEFRTLPSKEWVDRACALYDPLRTNLHDEITAIQRYWEKQQMDSKESFRQELEPKRIDYVAAEIRLEDTGCTWKPKHGSEKMPRRGEEGIAAKATLNAWVPCASIKFAQDSFDAVLKKSCQSELKEPQEQLANLELAYNLHDKWVWEKMKEASFMRARCLRRWKVLGLLMRFKTGLHGRIRTSPVPSSLSCQGHY